MGVGWWTRGRALRLNMAAQPVCRPAPPPSGQTGANRGPVTGPALESRAGVLLGCGGRGGGRGHSWRCSSDRTRAWREGRPGARRVARCGGVRRRAQRCEPTAPFDSAAHSSVGSCVGRSAVRVLLLRLVEQLGDRVVQLVHLVQHLPRTTA